MLLSRATCIDFHSSISFLTGPRGNRTRNLGVASAMPYQTEPQQTWYNSCTSQENTYTLADALIQSDLQEQLGLSILLKGTLTDLLPSWLGDSNQRPFGYWASVLKLNR